MKRVAVVGAGALGSHLVLLVRNLGATIRVIDFDRVEQKNVLSQFHGRPSVGKPKALALAQAMSFMYGTRIETNTNRLTTDNVESLIGGHDLVVDCLDNGASRKVVQDFVRARGVPCLHGALAADGGFGRSVWDEQFVIDFEPGAGAPTCEDGEHLPFVALTASYMARSVQEFARSGRKVGFQVSPQGATPL